MQAKKKRTRNTGYIIAGLRKLMKDPTATVRQKLDAIDRLAIIYGAYEVDLKPTRTIKTIPTESAPIEVISVDDEGEELLRKFNEKYYNGGDNAGNNA